MTKRIRKHRDLYEERARAVVRITRGRGGFRHVITDGVGKIHERKAYNNLMIAHSS